MNLLCKWFGHKLMPPGWWGNIPYMKIEQGPTDNIGRIHGRGYHDCHRCGETYLAGKFHINSSVITRALGVFPSSIAENGDSDGT